MTYGDREPVDAGLAAKQHAAYVGAIRDAGWAIREVSHADSLPDSAFVEDTVVVCDGLAVLTRPGAAKRCAEVAGTEAVRGLGLELARIEEPGTLDGGDILQVGTTLYAGHKGGPTPRASVSLADWWTARLQRGPRPVAPGAAPEIRGHRLPDGTVIAADPSLLDAAALPTIRIVPEEAGFACCLLGRIRPDGSVRTPVG